MRRNVAVTQRKTIGLTLAIGGFAAIAALTLTPNPGADQPGPSLCLVCGSYGGTDVVLNILLFIPFGFGLRLAGTRAWRAFVVAALTSLAIELLQIHVVVGRDASLGDLVSNSLGGAVGIALADHWRSWLLPSTRAARRLMSAGIAAWLLILVGSAWGVRPSLTRFPYWGHWASLDGPGPLFTGKLVAASVGRAPLPWAPISNSGELRQWLLHGDPLRATVIPGAPIDGLAPITRITDIRSAEIIMLGQQGRDLIFRMRTHASDLRLRDPAVRIENAFPDSAADASHVRTQSDTMRIAGGYTGDAYRVSVNGPRMVASRELRLGPGLGWSFFLPFSYASGRVTAWLTALWLAGLLAPMGYWAARAAAVEEPRVFGAMARPIPAAAPRLVVATSLVVMIVLGLGFVPRMFGEEPVQWWAWAACAVGGMLGAALGQLTMAAEGRGSQCVGTADVRG
ncbi:MAG TPA: VanZ family protein [Gemmatimonadaceae bacterium]